MIFNTSLFKAQLQKLSLIAAFLMTLFTHQITYANLAAAQQKGGPLQDIGSYITGSNAISRISCNEMLAAKYKIFITHFNLVDSYTSTFINDDKTIDNFIKKIDPDKIYLSLYDVNQFKQDMLSVYGIETCKVLNNFYFVYKKRVEEAEEFATRYISYSDFALDGDIVYTYPDYRDHPQSLEEYHKNLISFIQFEVAKEYVYSDLKKSIKFVSSKFKNNTRQVQSYNFLLSPQEKKECTKENIHLNKRCKPFKWYGLFLNAYAQSLDKHTRYINREDVRDFLEKRGYDISNSEAIISWEQSADSVSKKHSKKQQAPPIVKSDITNIKIHNSLNSSLSFMKTQSNGKNYKIAIIKLFIFVESSGEGIKALINEAKQKGADALIFNLSNNPGGSTKSSHDIAGLFIANGNITYERSRDNFILKEKIKKDKNSDLNYAGPLVVLVNKNSASASEILTGFLQDYKRAVVVGSTTFGKGSIQLFNYNDKHSNGIVTSGLEVITGGGYFTPAGKSPDQRGITPDILLPQRFSSSEYASTKLPFTEMTVDDFRSPEYEIDPYDKWEAIDDQMISYLKSRSQQRVSDNETFQRVIRDYKKLKKKEEMDKQENKTQITIAEVLDKKHLSTVHQISYSHFNDLLLEEASQIAADLADKQAKTK